MLGEAIKRERKRLALTQQQLAEFSGCGLTFINQLERGKPGVRLDKLVAVLAVIGMSLQVARTKDMTVSMAVVRS